MGVGVLAWWRTRDHQPWVYSAWGRLDLVMSASGPRSKRPSSGGSRGGVDTRGQSEVLSFLLLIAVTVAGTTAIVIAGVTALDTAQEDVTISQTENALTRVDAKISQVAIGDSPAQEFELAAGGGSVDLDREGWIRIRIINTSTGRVDATVLNRSLGTIVYENGNTTLAYQGGGVWRAQDGDSVMISKPEFHYRDGTLTFRLVNLTGTAGTGPMTVREGAPSVQKFPNESADFSNPVRNQKIQVTIHTPYYEGWGSHFEDRTDGGVEYDHANNQVTITLLKRPDSTRITEAMAAIGGGGDLVVQSGANIVVNNYNSSAIPPSLGPSSPPSTAGSADIKTTKDIDFQGNPEITGNLTTSGTVLSWSGSPTNRITGNLQYGTGTVDPGECNDYVGEWCAKNASLEDPEPIDGEIQATINDFNSSNDNAGESCFSESGGLDFTGCGSPIELDAGNYYTTSALQVTGDTLILNTTEGDIRIAVDDDKTVTFSNSANVTVIGNGTVRIYATEKYDINGADKVGWNRGWDAPQFWLYCTADCQTVLKSGVTFVGVIYAPSESGTTSAALTVKTGNIEVFGAVVGGGDAVLKANADIHFDRSISSTEPFELKYLPSISYLHVRSHQVNVSTG